MAASGSRGQEQLPNPEGILSVWEMRLVDAASVFQPFSASLVASQDIQSRIQDPNQLMPNRPIGTCISADDSRLLTLDLTTGLGKFAGRPASNLPQVPNGAQQRAPAAALDGQQVAGRPASSLLHGLNGAQQRATAAVEGPQTEAINLVMQVLKEEAEADLVLSRNIAFSRNRREEVLRLAVNKINVGVETSSRLFRERKGFPDVVNSWKQQMMLQQRKHDLMLTEMQDEHDNAVTELKDERRNSEKILVQKYEKFVKDMEAETALIQQHERTMIETINARKEEEASQLIRKGEEIVTEMKEAETALIQQHERTVAEMVDARKKEEVAYLIRVKDIVAKMKEERKKAETVLTQQHERVVAEMQEERLKSETLLVQKHDGMIAGMQAARKEAETLLIQEHERAVMAMRDVHEADRRLLKKNERIINDFEAQESRKNADQRMFLNPRKMAMSKQADTHRISEAQLIVRHGRTVAQLRAAHKEAERLLAENYEKVLLEADEARKEREARLLNDHKLQVAAGIKERETESLQRQNELEAEVEKFKNLYDSALESYSVLQKEHGEAAQALQAQLESLQCQLAAALKAEELGRTRVEEDHIAEEVEEDHIAEEVEELAVDDAVPKSPESSQLSTYKYTFTTRSKRDLGLVALQSELAQVQNEKVELQKKVDTLRGKLDALRKEKVALRKELVKLGKNKDKEIESTTDKHTISLLWEVAHKVLSFPEHMEDAENFKYSSGLHETLASCREENSVDKMMACLTDALETAATNWETAKDDFAKLKLAALGQHKLTDTTTSELAIRRDSAGKSKLDFTQADVDIVMRDEVDGLAKDGSDSGSLNLDESDEELPQRTRKRSRLLSLTELKVLKDRKPQPETTSQKPENPSRRKRSTPRRIVPTT